MDTDGVLVDDGEPDQDLSNSGGNHDDDNDDPDYGSDHTD